MKYHNDNIEVLREKARNKYRGLSVNIKNKKSICFHNIKNEARTAL